eukprot:2085511-Rhodomonas_salina.1
MGPGAAVRVARDPRGRQARRRQEARSPLALSPGRVRLHASGCVCPSHASGCVWLTPKKGALVSSF